MTKQCSNCTNLIPEKRLRAMPSAELCVPCQEMADATVPKPDIRHMNRLGSAGKFVTEENGFSTRYRPLISRGLSAAIAGGHGF